MQLKFNITHQDYVAFSKYTARFVRKTAGNFSYWFFALGLGILTGITTAVFHFELNAFFAGLVTGIVWVYLLAYHSRRYYILQQDGFLLGTHTYTFTPEGLTNESALHFSKTPWAAFISLEETSTHFFLYVDRVIAHILPKTAFATDEEMEQCRILLKGYIQPNLG